MGAMQAEDMVSQVPLNDALRRHLTANHFPPVSTAFMPAAMRAIDNANADDYDEEIDLPNGRTLTTAEVIEGLHLTPFVTSYADHEGDAIEWESA
jgi:hypothetical protein